MTSILSKALMNEDLLSESLLSEFLTSTFLISDDNVAIFMYSYLSSFSFLFFSMSFTLFSNSLSWAKVEVNDFRGSNFTYRNTVSLNTLNRDAELTYNPFYDMQLSLAPRYWISPKLFIGGSLALNREITQADDTTFRNESRLGDLRLGAGFLTYRTTFGMMLFTSLSTTLPTSLFSQGRSLQAGVNGGITLIQQLQSWGSLSYSFGGGYSFFEYTTGQIETPRIENCAGSIIGCDPFLSTGLRNAPWRQSHSLSFNWFPYSWLFFTSSITWIVSTLFPMDMQDPRVSFESQNPPSSRYLMSYNVEVDFQPKPWLIVALMANTFNPQLAPNSTYYAPFLNRFTTLMLDLRFTLGVFRVAQSNQDKSKTKDQSKTKARSTSSSPPSSQSDASSSDSHSSTHTDSENTKEL